MMYPAIPAPAPPVRKITFSSSTCSNSKCASGLGGGIARLWWLWPVERHVIPNVPTGLSTAVVDNPVFGPGKLWEIPVTQRGGFTAATGSPGGWQRWCPALSTDARGLFSWRVPRPRAAADRCPVRGRGITSPVGAVGCFHPRVAPGAATRSGRVGEWEKPGTTPRCPRVLPLPPPGRVARRPWPAVVQPPVDT